MSPTFQEYHIVTPLSNPGQSPILAHAQSMLNINKGTLPDPVRANLLELEGNLPDSADMSIKVRQLLDVHDVYTKRIER